MELNNPIFQIPDSNNVRSQKTGGGTAPIMRITGNQFRRHKIDRSREAAQIVSRASDQSRAVVSTGDRLFYEIQFHEDALAKSSQPRALLSKSHIDVYAQISDKIFLASSTAQNLSLFQNSIKRLTIAKNKNDSAWLSAISKIDFIKKKDKLTFSPNRIGTEGKFRAYLFLADVLSDEEGKRVASDIKEKTSTETEYFVSESGAKVVYGSFARRFIDEISTEDPRNPIVRIEKSIDFFASEELPTEYNLEAVTVVEPELDAKVAIVDSGIFNHPLLNNLIIDTEDCIGDSTKENLAHGTFVAGRTIFGNNIEEQLRVNQVLSATTRVLDIKVMKKDTLGTSDREIIGAILKVVTNPIHSDVKVFNLSLNNEADLSLHTGIKSFFTRELDSIAYKYKVFFVVTAGNQQTYLVKNYPACLSEPSSFITSPGDLVNGFSVGSLADSHSTRAMALVDEPSPFSRVGLRGHKKPDLVHYGGNCDGYGNSGGIGVKSLALNPRKISEGVGTSYAAPLVSGIASQIYAYLKSVGKESIDLTKALLLHSASYSLPSGSQINPDDQNRFVGFGVPNLKDALNCAKSTATFFYTGVIKNDEQSEEKKEYKHKLKFIVPPELAIQGKMTRIRATLVFTPLISELGQKDYVLADVEANLHYLNSRGTNVSAGLTTDPNDFRPRWNTIKSFEKTFSNTARGNYTGGDWEVWLNLTAREKADTSDYEQQYALVITVEDVSPDVATRLDLAQLIKAQYQAYIPINQQVRTRVQV